MSGLYKVTLGFNMFNVGVALNVYAFWDNGVPATDAALLANSKTWMERIYNAMSAFIADGVEVIDGTVQEAALNGSIIRDVGPFAPSINTTGTGGSMALHTAGGALARTNVPRVRGTKRWPGPREANHNNGLYDSAYVAALALATIEWLGGPKPGVSPWPAGVFSTKTEGFQSFNGSGRVTNIPSHQVTRKPGRGM